MARDIAIRQAVASDIDGICHVRFAVRENQQTPEQLQALGITPASVVASLATTRRGWVAEHCGHIVGFSMADRADSSIFALFVLPEHEGQGLGRRLLSCAVRWLWEQHAETLWLTTGPNTRAARLYQRAGWQLAGADDKGELRFELQRTV